VEDALSVLHAAIDKAVKQKEFERAFQLVLEQQAITSVWEKKYLPISKLIGHKRAEEFFAACYRPYAGQLSKPHIVDMVAELAANGDHAKIFKEVLGVTEVRDPAPNPKPDQHGGSKGYRRFGFGSRGGNPGNQYKGGDNDRKAHDTKHDSKERKHKGNA
jgi:hypothetical protein